MKRSFKFSVALLLALTTLLSGCIFPGDGWDRDGHRGHGEHGDRGGERGGEHRDYR